MTSFHYQPLFELGEDHAPYRKLSSDHVDEVSLAGRRILTVTSEGLSVLAAEAIRDISHLFRASHLEQVRAIYDDPGSSENDRFVALQMLKNANVAAGMILPSCQDTGTAIVIGHKGQHVLTEGRDAEALSHGIYETYTKTNLRYSQMAPLSMFEERNTRTNLPAQIEIYADEGDEYHFLFITKGGGSANKSYLYQETRAILGPDTLVDFIEQKMKTLGTAACPPYHLAVVIGGTSAELNLKTVKLASCRYLDSLPKSGNEHGRAFRDLGLEEEILARSRRLGIGAQFGGKYFCHDVRVIRLPRHGASLPVGIGVSCSADRQALAKITHEGIFLEKLERNPARFMPEVVAGELSPEVVALDLNRSMSDIRATLSRHPIKTRLSLTGPIIVARDIAHARLKERLDQGGELPEYFKNHIIYYAGPAKTPVGYASGSFGPTTAGRMDSYVDLFMEHGGSYVTLAKGNRSRSVTDSCRKHGGFYLGSIGGPAAILAVESIRKVEVVEFEELGMEAIWRIQVENFPAFIVVDDKGNDFFAQL
ncbi:MAG TPA: fumarate hydratase [Vicinamibacteria bacterium]|nr:fumarate hydratase [Vicinamibacteria bacterium]